MQRTLVQRTPPGKRQTVEHEGYLCHVYNADGLGEVSDDMNKGHVACSPL